MSVIKHHDQSNLSKADFGFVVLEDESHHPSLSQWGSTAAGTELTAHISNRKQRKSELKTTSILPSVSNSLPSARPQPLKFIQTRLPTGDQALERPETQGRSYSNPHRVWQAKLELTLTQIHFKKNEDWWWRLSRRQGSTCFCGALCPRTGGDKRGPLGTLKPWAIRFCYNNEQI